MNPGLDEHLEKEENLLFEFLHLYTCFNLSAMYVEIDLRAFVLCLSLQ